ncbi:MAG: hypothetical protein ACOYNY_07305 [Caldilineaceae bacterium]
MATRRKISDATRQRLEVIADYRCRYCRSPMAAGWQWWSSILFP